MVVATYFFRGNLLLPIGYSFRQAARDLLYPIGKTARTTAFDGTVGDQWLKIRQTANASTMQEDSNLYSRVLYHLSYVQLPPIKHTYQL